MLIIFAIALISLLALAGLVLDGGRAYGERRQMQNAADAASMAATQQLNLYLIGDTNDASEILDTAKDSAEENGADPDEVVCTLVEFDRSTIEPCPSGSAMSASTRAVVAGVRVETEQTQGTFFMRVIGHTDFTARADATAQIGRPGGTYVAPFIVCGTAPGHVPALQLPDADSDTGFAVNELAIGHEYSIYGNDIKNNGRDCGNPSSSFRGNANTDANHEIPGTWDSDTGNRNGPTLALVNSGNVCAPDFTVGCVVVLPLCPRSNGQGGTNFRAHCTDLGLFEISHVSNHDINAIFRGQATLNSGGIVGPADPSGARIVALTD